MVDLHVHSAPSWFERHAMDAAAVTENQSLGVVWSVLKAHEGCTAARACGLDGAVGGVVLNSPVGGANPAAVEGSARLGGRVVWMPTMSSRAHKAASVNSEIGMTSATVLDLVTVVEDGRLRPEWIEVLEVVAAHDLVLASGHLTCAESLVLFTAAAERGVRRMMVNHPTMSFMEWDDAIGEELRVLGVFLEIGILSDCLAGSIDGTDSPASFEQLGSYPSELWVFGSDLGSAHHPRARDILPPWFARFAATVGTEAATAVMTSNPLALLEADLACPHRARSLPHPAYQIDAI